jgi:hypothetical protein
MTLCNNDVKSVFVSVVHLANNTSYKFHSKDFRYSFSGLRHMTNDILEVRLCLAMLYNKMLISDSMLDVIDIEYILDGMRNMKENSVEVRQLLSLIAIKITASHKHHYTRENAIRLLTSISQMNQKCQEVRELVNAICQQVDCNPEDLLGEEYGNDLEQTSTNSHYIAVMLVLLTGMKFML